MKFSSGILILGAIMVIIGMGFIFSSGGDFSNLPLLGMTVKIGNVEITASDISPETQTKMMTGSVFVVLGIVSMATGTVLKVIEK